MPVVTSPPRPVPRRTLRPGPDAVTLGAVAGLLLLAAGIGAVLRGSGVPVHADAAPLYGELAPRLGPGTPAALGLAALVVATGPGLARRLHWPAALALAAAASLAWTAALAWVDGAAGLLAPLASGSEYPAEVSRVGSVPALLRDFVQHVPASAADPWTTHVAGHPPGALLVFVALDRVGLGGPAPAALLCLIATAAAGTAVAIGARAVCGEDWARRILPFGVLLPGAIWAGVSFDAVIAAVGAWGIALLALAARAPDPTRRALAGVGAGGLLGAGCLLSYGAVLLGLPALAVLAVAGGPLGRRLRVLALGAATAGAVLLLTAAAGFSWWAGYLAVRERYLAGFGGSRPYAYWVWADLAALALAAGPAVVVGLRRLAAPAPSKVAGGSGPQPDGARAAAAVAGGALLAVLLAALSGMSKAEVERIWLPWTVWLVLACGALTRGPASGQARGWLAAQALTALAVQHLVATAW